MNTTDFTTTIVVEHSSKEAFDAINNVRDWWQGEIEGNTDKLDDEFTYRMKEVHFSKQKLIVLIPNERIVWLVTDSKLNFTKVPNEWTGTNIIFEIYSTEKGTEIRFTHMALTPAIECYGGCSNAWGRLIQESLYSLITTGKGVNVFG